VAEKKEVSPSATPASKPGVDAWGIYSYFVDDYRTRRETSPRTHQAVRTAMGLEGAEPPRLASSPVRVVRQGEPVPLASPVRIDLEDGGTVRAESALPVDLPLGYHRWTSDQHAPPSRLIVAPRQCYLDPSMKVWAWAVQLHSVRSRHSWGLGDLADLRHLARWSAELGASAIVVSPLAAPSPVVPQQPSPYYPSSRSYRNPLYLRVEEVPGADRVGIDLQPLAEAGHALNANRRIDRDPVFRLKMQTLEQIWAQPQHLPALDAYIHQQAASLGQFATFCALAEKLGGDWRQWPSEFADCHSDAVRQFAHRHPDRIRFHQWLQWQLDEQLARAARELPIVNDLPVGMDPGGADSWIYKELLAAGASIGAPPDRFNSAGQHWSLPPFIPHKLREAAYEPFIQMVRENLRYAAGLRIDHVMGLFRTYWIPDGFDAADGAYVQYPADDLLGIVALESQRAGAWVAGEDLGTVEDHVRGQLEQHCMLSYRIFWFEPSPPDTYPGCTIAAMTTHDLPTVAGLWTGHDLAQRKQLGLPLDPAEYESMRRRLVDFASADEGDSTSAVVQKAHHALGKSDSAVVVATLEDALAVADRPNIPGLTAEQWPVWSLPLPQPLEEIVEAPLPKAIAQSLTRSSP
jgi:4-alpha-glucanotransferase